MRFGEETVETFLVMIGMSLRVDGEEEIRGR